MKNDVKINMSFCPEQISEKLRAEVKNSFVSIRKKHFWTTVLAKILNVLTLLDIFIKDMILMNSFQQKKNFEKKPNFRKT